MYKWKVALSAIMYPLSMASYFIRAFKRRPDVELFILGPFTGTRIPWANGLEIPYKYIVEPDLIFPESFIGVSPSASILGKKLPWEPDLFLQVDAGWHFSGRPPGRNVGLVQTDPHCITNYNIPKSYSDYSFCMQTPYMKPGDIFLPYAYDPTVHYPMDIEKKYDACLIGLHYPQRDQLVQAIKEMGYTVYYSIGEVYDENRIAYNQSRVALSWSSLLDTPARVYEAMGMGIPLLCNRTPDMDQFEDRKHYLGFDNLVDATMKFRELMEDKTLYNRIHSMSRAEVNLKHSWDLRVSQMMEVIFGQ